MQGAKAMPVKGKQKKPRVSNQVRLDPNNPIPFQTGSNTFSFIHGVSYLPFLPPKDNYAQDLLEARLLSVTNFACIDTKKDYCAGVGFIDANSAELPKEAIEWFKCMNLKGNSLTGINKQIFEDFFTWGNIPIEVVRFTVADVKKLFVYPHSFLEWRLGKPNEDDVVDYAIQSKLFLRNGYITAEMLKKSKKLPIYNPMKTEKENWFYDKETDTYRTLFWYHNRVSGIQHYGLPSNVASMIYQILEYKEPRYNLDNFDNNLVSSGILALKGQLGQEEADRIGKKVINTHTGDGKRGRVIVVASEEGVDGSDFHKLDNKTDGSYIEATKSWEQKIILANKWDAILAGIVSPSTLGKGASFIRIIYEEKLKSVIRPAQQHLMEHVWSHILGIANKWLNLGIDGLNLQFDNAIDISGLTDVDITEAVQVNEVRKAKGLPEDPNMAGVYMKSKKGGENVQP